MQALETAKASIDLCIAWFTNETLRDKLLDKQGEGCVVRVIRYKDGINKSKGVDLTGIVHLEIRGERHGIMHRKFCVIDNQTVLDGSYNWTNSAETKNDKDINVHKNTLEIAYFLYFILDLWYNKSRINLLFRGASYGRGE